MLGQPGAHMPRQLTSRIRGEGKDEREVGKLDTKIKITHIRFPFAHLLFVFDQFCLSYFACIRH